MPRYLGINYFQKTLAERREFYNNSLLLTPKLLDSAGHHVQCITLQSLYERITDTTYIDELTRHENELNDFLDIKVSPNYDKLESSYEICENGNDDDEDDVEVIPSSNPDSPDFVLNKAEIKLEKEIESFEIENLTDMDSLCEKYMLEEVVSINLKYQTKMPTLDQLNSKLQPKDVKDPLCDSHGEVYTEEKMFGSSISLVGNHQKLKEEFHGEEFQEEEVYGKVSMSEEKENNLEEILSPKTHSPKDIININYQNMLENSQPDSQSPVKLPSEIYDELSRTDVRTKKVLEKGIFDWKSVTEHKEFTEFNNDGNMSRYLEEEFIESPLACTEQICYDKTFASAICENVEYFAMPLLKTKKLLLREVEEKFLYRAFWEKEKYYDEDLYIRCQVPELTKDQLHTIPMMAKLLSCDIPCEKGLGECELKLTWDPFPETLNTENAVEKWTDKKNMSANLTPLSIEKYNEKFNIKKEDSDERQSSDMLSLNKKISESSTSFPSSLDVNTVYSRKRLQPFSSINEEKMTENKIQASPSKDMSAHEKAVSVKDVGLSPSLSPPSPSDNLIYLTSVNNRHMQLSSHCINKSGTELTVANHSDTGRLSQSNISSDELTSPEKKKKKMQEQSLNDETYTSDIKDNISQKKKD